MAAGSRHVRGVPVAAGSRTDRGVSEFAGVAILISLTVLVTASVGLFVLVVDADEGGPKTANFSFEFIDQSNALVITHERGSTFDAGNLTVRSASSEVRWHELAGSNETAPVGPGARVQLSSGSAYGSNVGQRDTIQVVYTPDPRNETVLETWNG